MQTDADDPARVRDPAIELLLSHTATLTGEWCSRRRARRQLGLVSARPNDTERHVGVSRACPNGASAVADMPVGPIDMKHYRRVGGDALDVG
jgi:hypothetical protein